MSIEVSPAPQQAHRNRRRYWRAAALSLVTAALPATLVQAPAHAVAAPVTITQVQPVNPSATNQVYVERVAPRYAGDAAGWRLNMDMRVNNTHTSSVTLSSVQVSYPGSSITAQTFSLATSIPRSGLDGSNHFLKVPDNRINAFPVPATVRIQLNFSGYDAKVFTRSLVEYVNKTPSGGYRFPASTVSGGRWRNTVGHDVGSHHRGVHNQRYAYDLDVVKWNGSTWSHTKPGTTDATDVNTDHYSFGLPIYAMADGTIRKCRRDQADNTPGVLKPEPEVEGNHLYIEHATGEVALYAHFKAGSISTALCPSAAGSGLNIPVKQGQLLGYSGNSGNSSRPHLHLHLADKAGFGDYANPAQGLPLRFNHATVRSAAAPSVTPGFTALTNSSEAALRQGQHISPNGCGWQRVVPGGTQWARHGVKSTCWQEEFNDTALAGYRLVWRQQVQDGSLSRVASIWRPAAGLPWVARNGQSSAQHQATFDTYRAAGYRLTHVDSYLEGGVAKYSSVFTKTSGPAWTAYHGVTATNHQSKFTSLTRAGYVPRQISVVYVGGERRYTALYEKASVGAMVSLQNIAETSYQTVYNQQVAAGRRPVHLDTYLVGANVKFSAIFTSAAPATVARHGLTAAQYQAEFTTQSAAGRLLVSVTAYRSGSVLKYAALWN
ncbi:hypothetical protein ASE01_18070 [Nocardioides sp. Root190]|uniref:peptidoglycan DD-metalloendopeptidase family protein n=1 Tax=Nocardioides sp. Root190 TaxID=1736488 RepID=UPI0006F5BDF2|nr:peptidoglycan DD-metalloendopeptidase family protein [Nocardioides sp. Root190]KRB73912.1 hypothetical protein ASE01_18070 [Nocardioides sp. Root190]